jgi:hypothetical protein
MKTNYFFILFLLSLTVFAQKPDRPQPESWKTTTTTLAKVAPIVLQKPDLSALRSEDVVNDRDKSIPWRFGYDHHVNFGLENSGSWTSLANGDRIWRVNIISPEALSLNLIFSEYYIPVGGKVYVYNNDRSEILNVYTDQHNNPEEILGTWMVSGEHIWIEYFEPKTSRDLGRLTIGNIVHGYRTLNMHNSNTPSTRSLNDSGPCNVDVNCDITATSVIANDIKDNVKKSVGMIVVGGNGACTGALVNNTNNDGTPYFLTANHCLGGSVGGWAFRFNWSSDESVADCATNAPSVDNSFIQTASGAILRAANSESDMALVEITDTDFFNANPDVVWAGWNRSTTTNPNLNVGIHHPRGDIKKVCVDLQGASRFTTSFNGNPTTEVWRIADWDLGVTEPGSSGSPLFDEQGLIIGKLSGGSAACNGTIDNGGFDIYGRFGVSWDFSAVSSQQLKFWLDPAGTNPITLDRFPVVEIYDFDAAISVRDIPTDVCDEEITPILRIKNEGNNTLTNATVTYQLDSTTETTINWTGSLAIGETDDITLSPISVSSVGDHSFVATVSNPNGNTDQGTSNNANTKNFGIPDNYETTVVRVVITPDRYGGETTWDITDANGTQIANGGPYTTTNTNGTQPDEITDVTITNFDVCYTFTINDSFGDGICCQYGAGTFQLQDTDGTVLFDGNGSFDNSFAHIFQAEDILSTTENELSERIQIYPNPVTTDVNIQINGESNLSYDIITIVGQKIKTGVLNNGVHRISLKDQASGVYFIQISNTLTNERVSKKIIKY